MELIDVKTRIAYILREMIDEYLPESLELEVLKARLKNYLGSIRLLKTGIGGIVFQPIAQKQQPEEEQVQLDSEEPPFFQQAKFISKLNDILENIYVDPSTTIATIAFEIAMSERQFFRKVKSSVNMTPSKYLRLYRLEKSKSILKDGYNIQHAAFQVGFSSQSHFSKCFRAQFGCSPKDYKNA